MHRHGDRACRSSALGWHSSPACWMPRVDCTRRRSPLCAPLGAQRGARVESVFQCDAVCTLSGAEFFDSASPGPFGEWRQLQRCLCRTALLRVQAIFGTLGRAQAPGIRMVLGALQFCCSQIIVFAALFEMRRDKPSAPMNGCLCVCTDGAFAVICFIFIGRQGVLAGSAMDSLWATSYGGSGSLPTLWSNSTW